MECVILIGLLRNRSARQRELIAQALADRVSFVVRERQGKARVPDVAIFTCANKLEPPVLEDGFDELQRL